MKAIRTDRGFVLVTHAAVGRTDDCRLLGESSAIGDYKDAYDNPGSSHLWIGEHHHLDREEVAEMIARMAEWLAFGRLDVRDSR